MRARNRMRSGRKEWGGQLVELAFVLPILAVMVAGAADFGQAWNARQILANAARDGARLGANQTYSDLDNSSPASVEKICQQVADYLQQENVSLAFMNNVNNSGSSSATVSGICATPGVIQSQTCTTSPCVPQGWYYSSIGTYGPNAYGLTIERIVGVPPSGYTTCGAGTLVSCIQATRVTLNYPYNWSFGFDHVVNFFGPSNYPSTVPIRVYSLMPNLAG